MSIDGRELKRTEDTPLKDSPSDVRLVRRGRSNE